MVGEPWTVGCFTAMLVMWIIMMVGMMVPSAIPMALIYASVAPGGGSPRKPAGSDRDLCDRLYCHLEPLQPRGRP
jgi:Predicted metal-binding integral membrane protein (DUF2182)